jgi:hypothetical protein
MYLFMNKASGTCLRFIVSCLLAVVAVSFLSSCGTSIREIRREYDREAAAFAELDLMEVLAGREPEAVLAEAFSHARCAWKEKALFSMSDHSRTVIDHTYDAGSRRLTLTELYDAGLYIDRDCLIYNKISAELPRCRVRISPPDMLGTVHCYAVRILCKAGSCIQVDRLTRTVKDGAVVEESEVHEHDALWEVLFADRDAAVDAYAALRTLAE